MTDTELAAIRERLDRMEASGDEDGYWLVETAKADLATLLAEVERLKAEIFELEGQIESTLYIP